MRLRPDKVTANAAYLMIATVTTSLVGLLFWAVAARGHQHDTSALGTAYAEISALVLLSTVAQLNLTNVFIRFLPAAGRLSTYFVSRGYFVVSVCGLVAGAAFVLSGLGAGIIPAGWPARGLFIGAVALMAIFALQDSVITALRITHWVPIENVAFAFAKLGLLVWFLAFLSGQTAIVIAWVLPVGVAVLVVNGLLFSRVLPAISATDEGDLPPRRRMLSFVAAEYGSTLLNLAAGQLLPLVVIWRLNATAEYYFAVPWLIGSSIAVVFWNIGSSFIVEAVTAGEQSARLLRRALELWSGLVAASILSCAIAGPTLLGVVGHSYAVHGGTLLRLIGLSTPFTLVTVVYQTFVWFDQRVWQLVAIAASVAASMLVVSIVLMPSLGISGVGWAFFGTQVASAAVMWPSVFRRVRVIAATGAPAALRAQRGGGGDPPEPVSRPPAPRVTRAGGAHHWRSPKLLPDLTARTTTVTAWVGLAVAVVAPLLIIASLGRPLTAIAIFAFAGAGFGPAVTCRLDTGDPVAQAALTVAVSLAAYAIGATLLIWAAAWHPTLLLLLAIPTVASCLHRLLTAHELQASGSGGH